MSSEKRTEANRQNAKKSTGPRTAEGKAASARNALKHGLTAEKFAVIPGEDPEAYFSDLQAWLAHCDGDPMQMALAERGCRVAWQLRRIAIAGDAQIAMQAR